MIMVVVVVMIRVVMMAVAMLVRVIMSVRTFFESHRLQQRPALHPQETQTDQQNERIADDFDHAYGIAHNLRRSAKESRDDPNDGDCGNRLQNGGRKREHNAAPPGLVVRHQIGRDHRLAVARSRGMKDTIKKRDAEQGVGSTPVRLGGANEPRQHPIKFGLLCKNPAGEAANLGWRCASIDAEWLRHRGIDHNKQKQKQKQTVQHTQSRQPVQGQCTRILLANCAPQAIVVFFSSAGISLSDVPSAKVISRGNTTSSLHFGAPASCTGLSLANAKSTKMEGSQISTFTLLCLPAFF